MNILEGLDAESMLSEHWDSNSEDEDDNLSRYNNRDDRGEDEDGRASHDRQRKASLETSSSCRTDGSSSMVWVPQRPLSPSSAASSRNSRSRNLHHLSSISQQIRPDSRLSNQPQHTTLEMREMNGSNDENGKPNHQSWPLNNMSTMGIVTGLSPEFDGHGDDVQRPHSSLSRYQTTNRKEGGEGGRSKYKDPRVERYLHHARSSSPTASSNVHSSTSNHRPNSRHYHHRRHNSNHLNESDFHNNRKASSDIAASSATTAAEALRAKAGSRATNYRPHNQHRSSKTGKSDTWSVHETVISTDEHNYLAPLPPFQQGPAYTRVPKRKFCKCFCGGCRWWVLLLLIFIPAALIAVAAAFLLHWFRVCIAIDPTTVAPIIYTIDPATVQGISLDYQTRTDEANKHKDFFISSVLCSDSILTIEMPRPRPLIPNTSTSINNYTEIGLDIQLDQQDVFINLDQTLHRNATWKFRGVSNRNMVVQSLNINALSISYTSTSPSTVVLQNVIVWDQLAVMSVSGDINAAVGFGALPSLTPSGSKTTPTTVNLNTLDGQIQLDISRGWNQSSTFQIDSPDIQLSKAGVVILPFGGTHNRTDVSVNGLKAAEGQHSLTGSFKPQTNGAPQQPPPTSSSSASSSATGTGTLAATPTATPGIASALGAGGSAVPAQLMIQANMNVAINFP
ncbi:hypothetical protein BGW39_005254 [Mortierella sp. 14UC]|nr:hypothetical protein BGW39_005254 [Mortierella sp. 14UC]